MARMEAFGRAADFLPNTTLADKLSIGEGRDRIDLYYFGAGHTNGDIVVAFPGKRLAYLGDLFPGKSIPVIDAANGGSGVALAGDACSRGCGAEGHPEDHSRATLFRRRAARSGDGSPWPTSRNTPTSRAIFSSAVQEAFKAGKTVDDAASGLTLSERYPAYNFDNARASVQALYNELRR